MSDNVTFAGLVKSIISPDGKEKTRREELRREDEDKNYDFYDTNDYEDDTVSDSFYDSRESSYTDSRYAEERASKLISSRKKKNEPQQTKANITQIDSVAQKSYSEGIGSKIVYVDPDNIDSAYVLVDYLKEKKTVVLILDRTGNDAEAQRIVDFMSGAICALNGSIEPISSHIFVVTPRGVENIDKRNAR